MALERLSRSLGLIAALDSQLPLHFVRVFVFVASSRSCTYAEIEQALDLHNSSVSRTLHALGARHRSGEKGLGLVEVFIDPEQGRRYRARLTKKGRALLQALELIESSHESLDPAARDQPSTPHRRRSPVSGVDPSAQAVAAGADVQLGEASMQGELPTHDYLQNSLPTMGRGV